MMIDFKLIDDNEEIKLEMTDYDDTEVKEMINEVDNKVDNLSTQVNHEINEIEDDIDELDGRIRINTNNISNLQQTKADKTQVNALSTQVQANTIQIGQNKADITALNNRVDQIPILTKTSQLTNDSGFITKDVNNLTYYELKTNTGSLIDLEINDTTYVVTLKLKNSNGTTISTDTIDLPLESVVVGGSYDSETKEVVLSLEGGSEVRFSVADLVSGLQSEITSSNKLASDLVDDSNSGNKFVTTSEKTTWNGKYTKPSGGIPKTDLTSEVQTSLGKADTALQSSDLTNYVTNTDYATTEKGGTIRISNTSGLGISNGNLYAVTKAYNTYNSASGNMFIGKGTLENVITGKNLETSNNKVTSISSSSTNTEYPSAKAVYDYIQSLNGDEVNY